MLSNPDEWVLLHVERGSVRELAQHLRLRGLEAFVPLLSPTDDSDASTDMFPGHVLADASLEETQSDAYSPIDWSVITNRSNRPFVIPGSVAMALKDPNAATGGDLLGVLSALAPDYRIEHLMVECTRWQLTSARK